jgi:hypothetical protein
MLAKVFSCALIGLEGAVVEAELNPRSLPAVTLVGLPDAAVKESTERVWAAISDSGLSYPRDRQAPTGQRSPRTLLTSMGKSTSSVPYDAGGPLLSQTRHLALPGDIEIKAVPAAQVAKQDGAVGDWPRGSDSDRRTRARGSPTGSLPGRRPAGVPVTGKP